MKQNSVVETSLGKSAQSQSQDENLCCRDDKLNVSDNCDDLKSIVDDANLVAIGALELEPKTNLYILDGSSTFSSQGIKIKGHFFFTFPCLVKFLLNLCVTFSLIVA